MILEQIRDVIDSTLMYLCQNKLLPKEIEEKVPLFVVEFVKNPDHGDYATNVAMMLAKSAKKSPKVLGEMIVQYLQDEKKVIQKASVAGPGFINLVISDHLLQSVIPQVLKAKDKFATHSFNHQKALVEFVSANPTGPLHLGHARGAFMGDAVARLLTAAGYKVTREFYVNDVGNQVQTLARSIYARYQEFFGQKVELLKDAYPGAYIIDIAKKIKEADGDKWLSKPEEVWLKYFRDFGIQENLKNIKETLLKAGIEIDNWYFEHFLHDNQKVEKIIQDYQNLNMLYEAELAHGSEEKVRREESKSAKYAHQQLGGTFLKTSQLGDEEDRILLKKNKEPVYLVADLAYHQEKFERGFERMIDVFGADHAGHVPRVKAGMRALLLDDSKLEFLLVQIVHLLKEGKEVRFSKRSGEIYLLDDLLEEVGTDVARFAFLMRSAHAQFDFDLDLALEQSNDNPVYYVQYGHARMATLLKRATEEGKAFAGEDKLKKSDLALLVLPEERRMLMKMDFLPELVLQAANSLEPHRVIYFCQELIGEFHSYFTKYRHSERVISENASLTQGRLALVAALKQTLYNALSLLNISAPEYMGSPDS